VLPQNSADTVGPATVRLEIGFDRHAVNVFEDRNGARYRAHF
jgi:hypothetical protein